MNRFAITLSALAVLTLACSVADAHGWEGKRRVSQQRTNDMFYNYYAGPNPSGAAAHMYVSPQPVPAQVGHTYTTYQPFMPHEYLYGHQRSYYSHHPGAGWTRTNVRYGTFGGTWQAINYGLYDSSLRGWLGNAYFNTRP